VDSDLFEHDVGILPNARLNLKRIRYEESAELIKAFLERLGEIACTEMLEQSGYTINELAAALKPEATTDGSAELRIVRFGH
jgi:hypothetical protein